MPIYKMSAKHQVLRFGSLLFAAFFLGWSAKSDGPITKVVTAVAGMIFLICVELLAEQRGWERREARQLDRRE